MRASVRFVGVLLCAARDGLTGRACSAWQHSPHLLAAPSIVLVIAALGFNFIGDGLNDALDPRRVRQPGPRSSSCTQPVSIACPLAGVSWATAQDLVRQSLLFEFSAHPHVPSRAQRRRNSSASFASSL